jgi:hypothetical protein
MDNEAGTDQYEDPRWCKFLHVPSSEQYKLDSRTRDVMILRIAWFDDAPPVAKYPLRMYWQATSLSMAPHR